MESVHSRTRWIVSALAVLVIFFLAGFASAQGLFGVGLPGLPSFGGWPGGSYACGEKLFPRVAPLELYVGWMDGPGTCVGAGTNDIGFAGITSLKQKYRNQGVWFGLADTVNLTDCVSFMASGWYLVPSNTVSRQDFNDGGPGFGLLGRSWNTNSQWWWVDGLFIFGPSSSPCSGPCCCGPAALLVGLRYNYFTTRFQDQPFDPTSPTPPPPPTDDEGDQADVISQAWIPLIGVQTRYEGADYRLLARAVGFPTVLGSVQYNETILVANRLEATGNYSGGAFLEVFTEYARKFSGGEAGVFLRWDYLQGYSNLNVDFLPAGGSKTFRLGLTQNVWTIGGSFALNFNTPL